MIDNTKIPELNRFLVLFDGDAATPIGGLEWGPTEGGAVRFGARLSNVTIRALNLENRLGISLPRCGTGAGTTKYT